MRRAVRVFLPLALRYIFFHFFFMAQVEGNGAIDLLQAKRGVVRSDGFWRFALLEFPHEVG